MDDGVGKVIDSVKDLFSEPEIATKRLMIYGIKQINEESKVVFDYISCPYPEGNIGAGHFYFFNHAGIIKIDFVGFIDAEGQVFRLKLDEEIKKVEWSINTFL